MLLSASRVRSLFLAGCTVGPNYKRPNTDVPTAYRGAMTADEAASASAPSLGEQKWWEVFQDEQLQQLIRTALQQNYDVRIAATHILEAQAQVGIARANQFPNVNVSGTGTGLRNPATGPIPSYSFNYGRVTANAAWDLDFWGKYRRATEAARAQFAGERLGAPGSERHARRKCRRGIFSASRTGPGTGNFARARWPPAMNRWN